MAELAGDGEHRLVYLRGVVALCGAAIDRVGVAGSATVPPAWRQKRCERDGDEGFHVTFLAKADVQSLAARLRDGVAWPEGVAPPSGPDPESIARAAALLLLERAASFVWVDVGEGRAAAGGDEAAFRIVLWPAASMVRDLLGLQPLDFHLSLGFSSSDIHGKGKGLSSLVSGVPAASAVPQMNAAARQVLSSPRCGTEMLAGAELLVRLALEGADAHADVPGQIAALETQCRVFGRGKQMRQLLEAAERLLQLEAESLPGHRSRAVALMALKRYADARPELNWLDLELMRLPESAETASLRKWLVGATEKCRDALGSASCLFPGAEDHATEAGDQDFEDAFLTRGSALKFPSTAHLKNLGAASREDKLCDDVRRKQFCGGLRSVSVEEKIDGANLGISLDSAYRFRMQARSKLVNWKTDSQFAALEQWLNDHASTLCEILERNNDILFGEWCAYLHTVRYTGLPGYFLAFDIYDRRRGRFLSRESFHTRLQRATGPRIPAVPTICTPRVFTSEEEVEALLQRRSSFGPGALEGVYLRIDEAVPAEGGERESYLVDRCKLVRSEFQQAIEEEGSWRGRGKNDLDVALATTYLEQCFPCARAATA